VSECQLDSNGLVHMQRVPSACHQYPAENTSTNVILFMPVL